MGRYRTGTKTHKLKAVWTREFVQDLNDYHSIEANHNMKKETFRNYAHNLFDFEISDKLKYYAIDKLVRLYS